MNETEELPNDQMELMDSSGDNNSMNPPTTISHHDALTQVISFTFTCDICQEKFTDQFNFFGHLKNHYDNQQQTATSQQTKREEIPTPAPITPTPTKITTPKKKQVNKNSVAVTAPPVDADPLESDVIVLTNKCQICRREFKKPHNLKAHMRYTHPEASEHPSPSRNVKVESFHATTSYTSEESGTVDGNEVKLEATDEDMFAEEEDVGLTLTEDHENDTEDFQCSTCGDLFVTPEGLAEHSAQEHGEEETESSSSSSPTKRPPGEDGRKVKDTLKCPECDRCFNHRNSLNYHMRSHTGERPHQCQICGKSFFATSALKVHMRLHSGEKPYACDHCGRKFRQWGDLTYHVISIHSDIRQYQCEFCGKDFARKYSLTVHRRCHTGERNYKCEFCGKCFRAASYLQNHRKIHTGEKPHNCDICGKPFRVRSDMKRHMTSHTRREGPQVQVQEAESEVEVTTTENSDSNSPTKSSASRKESKTTAHTHSKRKTAHVPLSSPETTTMNDMNIVAMNEAGELITIEPELARRLQGQLIQVPVSSTGTITLSQNDLHRISLQDPGSIVITGDVGDDQHVSTLQVEDAVTEIKDELIYEEQPITISEENMCDPNSGITYVWNPVFMSGS